MIVMYIDFRDRLFLEMTPQSVAAATAQMNQRSNARFATRGGFNDPRNQAAERTKRTMDYINGLKERVKQGMNPVNPNMTYNQFIGNNYNSHRAGYNDRKYYEQQARQWGK